jgi:dinuclear metal center YbgI/SA1388 family protein
LLISELEAFLDDLIPLETAQEWDNVGLQVGNRQLDVEGIVLSVDLSSELLNKAIEAKANVLITHHPLIFKPIKNVLTDDTAGSLIHSLIKNEIALYCCHTNLDAVQWGVSDALAAAIGLDETKPLSAVEGEKKYKLVTFLPPEHLEVLRNAVCGAGAGVIGDYSNCTFSSSGTGTFMCSETTKHSRGEKGRLESVQESRFETVVDSKHVSKAIKAMLGAHPYEEPAYDLIPLENPSGFGLGKIGDFRAPVAVESLVNTLKDKLNLKSVRLLGDSASKVQTVAVCGGSGSNLVEAAYKQGAQLFVAGEFGYHCAMDAQANSLSLLEVGHGVSEKLILDTLKEKIEKKLTDEGKETPVYIIEQDDIWKHV